MIREVLAAVVVGYSVGACAGQAVFAVAVPSSAAGAFTYDQTEPDPDLAEAISKARAMWSTAGIRVPIVDVVVGAPPGLADGYFYPAYDGVPAHIVVRYRRVDVIAHELGHAAGLMHVHGATEIMAHSIGPDAVIGPATLAEARRIGLIR